LREIPSVVGGDEESRHGIVLAKSIPSKKYGIQTGETLFSARQKCRELVIVPPRYSLYMQCSSAMVKIFNEYTPVIQRFSIDECFLDFTGMENHYNDFIELAYTIKDRIKSELGFTVSIGISNNKLLAKMGSDLKKPDAVTTLFPHEIKEKMWPLPVEDLFMVGRATAAKLHKMNIFTIGELANFDTGLLRYSLKSHGILIWNYANGVEDSQVRKSNHMNMKGMGNSTTIPFDVEDKETAHLVLLSLAECVGARLRDSGNCCRLISVSIRGSDLVSYSKQRKFDYPLDSTTKIARFTYRLFDELWKGNPIRHLGIHVTELCSNEMCQLTLFDEKDNEKLRALDRTIDEIRSRFGSKSVFRSAFLHSGVSTMSGGIGEEDYPLMTSIL
jgi:DNA polymerase IV